MYKFPFFQTFLCASLLSLWLSGTAQDGEFTYWQKRLATEIEFYGEMNPFDDPQYSLASLPLEPAVKIYTRAKLESTDDNALLDTFDAQAAMQNQIFYTLGQLLHHPKGRTLDYQQFDDYPFGAYRSEDQRFWSFQLAENHGGTYQSRLSALCYFPEEGEAIMLFPPKNRIESTNERDPFYPDGYESLIHVPSDQGTFYLLQGMVRTCGMCFDEYTTLVQIKDGTFHVVFEYAVGSRSPAEHLTYTPSDFRLSVSYQTDDLAESCTCNMDEPTEEPDYDITKQCTCIFEFDGYTFQLTESSESIVEDRQD